MTEPTIGEEGWADEFEHAVGIALYDMHNAQCAGDLASDGMIGTEARYLADKLRPSLATQRGHLDLDRLTLSESVIPPAGAAPVACEDCGQVYANAGSAADCCTITDPLTCAVAFLTEYSGKLWKEGQQSRSIRVGKTAAALATQRAPQDESMIEEFERLNPVEMNEARRQIWKEKVDKLTLALKRHWTYSQYEYAETHDEWGAMAGDGTPQPWESSSQRAPDEERLRASGERKMERLRIADGAIASAEAEVHRLRDALRHAAWMTGNGRSLAQVGNFARSQATPPDPTPSTNQVPTQGAQ